MHADTLGSTMRVVHPGPGLLGFYDGRIAGRRAFSEAENWLDDGAYSLGVCTYAIVDGAEALVYDTHISLAHANIMRRVLAEAGVTSIRVVLSHWHADHIAGNAVFADCPIIANTRTGELLAEQHDALESGLPPIRPLVPPSQLFDDSLPLRVGGVEVLLRRLDIHSEDGTVLLLPDRGLLFAGDTLEDPITYVAEPARLAMHLRDLDRLGGWGVRRILPNHGALAVIERGGYAPGLIGATRRYVEKLLLCASRPELAALSMAEFLGEDAQAGVLEVYAPYEAVHRRNVRAVLSAVAPA